MRKLILLLLLFIFIKNISAQPRTINGPGGAITVGGSPAMPGVVGYVNGKALYVINETEIEGSPYLNDQWAKGTVIFRNGKSTDRVPLKLSLYDGQLYFDMGGNTNIFYDSIQTVKLMIGDTTGGKVRTFIAFPGKPSEYLANTFMELLGDGSDIQLLKYEKRIIEEYKDVSQVVHRRFKINTEYYIRTRQGEMQKIKLTKESLAKALGADAAKMEKLIEERHLKLKGEASFIELINQLNASTPLKAF